LKERKEGRNRRNRRNRRKAGVPREAGEKIGRRERRGRQEGQETGVWTRQFIPENRGETAKQKIGGKHHDNNTFVVESLPQAGGWLEEALLPNVAIFCTLYPHPQPPIFTPPSLHPASLLQSPSHLPRPLLHRLPSQRKRGKWADRFIHTV
jgi:hypothetical protein